MDDEKVDRYAPRLAIVCDAQALDLAVGVERQFGVGHVIAAVRVGQERFRPLGRPFDRPVDLLRRPGANGLLGVNENLGAEAAADVGRDDAQLVSRERCRSNADSTSRARCGFWLVV